MTRFFMTGFISVGRVAQLMLPEPQRKGEEQQLAGEGESRQVINVGERPGLRRRATSRTVPIDSTQEVLKRQRLARMSPAR